MYTPVAPAEMVMRNPIISPRSWYCEGVLGGPCFIHHSSRQSRTLRTPRDLQTRTCGSQLTKTSSWLRLMPCSPRFPQIWYDRAPCVTMTPFGLPVDPLVYCRKARSSGGIEASSKLKPVPTFTLGLDLNIKCLGQAYRNVVVLRRPTLVSCRHSRAPQS